MQRGGSSNFLHRMHVALSEADNEPLQPASELSARLKCFAFLWAMSVLFQLFALGSVFQEVEAGTWLGFVELALVFAAIAVIRRPTLRNLLILSSLQICDAVLLMPQVSNNRLLSFFINITLILAYLRNRSRRSDEETREQNIFIDFCRTARIELVLFYFFAVFAKINTGFLSSLTSCASTFYARMASSLPFFPSAPWALETVIYVTIFCEAAIPIFLIFRKSRNLGIALGILFHLVLSFDYFQHTMDFGSILFALFFLFTADNFLSLLKKDVFQYRRNEDFRRDLIWARIFLLLAIGIVVIAGFTANSIGIEIFFYSKHVLWYSYAALVAVIFFVALIKVRFRLRTTSPIFGATGIMAMPVLLLILNGCGPYIGLKTRSSFDMYSNLRMEQPQPNHLIIPSSLDLWGFQSDRIRIINSNDTWLNRAKDRGVEILYFEFASYVARKPNLLVEYTRNGKEYVISNEQERLLLETSPALARKVLWFRNVDLQPLSRCDW